MPARHRNSKLRRKKRSILHLFKYLIPAFFVFFLLFYFLLSSKNWNGKDKLSLAVARLDGSVNVLVFDPASDEISDIFIPGNSEVDVSGNLGIWKLRSVWILGQKDSSGGELLARTVTKHFKFPVFLWSEDKAYGFVNNSYPELFKALIFAYDTNLTFKDKLKLAFYALGVRDINKINIDLGRSSYLKKTKLVDGEEGFILSGQIPQKLAAVFADPRFSENTLKIEIMDATGGSKNVETVAEILEVLGGKVASIERGDREDINCFVSGKSEDIIKTVKLIFGCESSLDLTPSSFDLRMSIGEKFIDNF